MYTQDQLNEFYRNYRDSLERQYQTGVQSLEQQRRNAQATIMSGANKAGMMYSSFVPREKIKYDASTYTPALIKMNTTYRSGLDSLRNNVLKYQNSIREIQDSIAHLNSMA